MRSWLGRHSGQSARLARFVERGNGNLEQRVLLKCAFELSLQLWVLAQKCPQQCDQLCNGRKETEADH